jgi:hypothetical protein
MNNNFVVFSKGLIDPKDMLYKFYDFPQKDQGPIALIANIDV